MYGQCRESPRTIYTNCFYIRQTSSVLRHIVHKQRLWNYDVCRLWQTIGRSLQTLICKIHRGKWRFLQTKSWVLVSDLRTSVPPRLNDLRKLCVVKLTIFNKNKLSTENKSKSFYYVIYIVKIYLNYPLYEMYNAKIFFKRTLNQRETLIDSLLTSQSREIAINLIV